MRNRGRREKAALSFALLLVLAAACASRKDEKYKVSEQPPAKFITEERGPEDTVVYGEDACPRIPPLSSPSAYDYLKALAEDTGRRSGTQGYRCAAAFARELLSSFGYQVSVIEYSFPYYDFDLERVKVKRLRDGKEFPAYPMHYSLPARGERQGKVCKPRPGPLTGCFVYVKGGMFSRGLTGKYEAWKERGAIGIIREADMRPLGAKGLRHSARAHKTSWHYAPLPGFVVENAGELVGETIMVENPARIVEGRGYDIVARGPVKKGRPVLITAHLDCWFKGALDDGSGAAALLEAARLLKDSPEDLVFLLADSEEIGLVGSAVFMQEEEELAEEVSAAVELDMVSTFNNFGKNKSPATAGVMPKVISISKGLRGVAKERFAGLGGKKLYLPLWLNRRIFGGLATDLEWLFAAGKPGVFIYTPSKFYHTEKDTVEWIPPEDLERVAESVAELARALREEPPPSPPRVVSFSFKVEPAGGDTVRFLLKPEERPGAVSLKKENASVFAFYEMGYEEKKKLEKNQEGWFEGEYRLPRPGRWSFLAVYSKGKFFGKKWLSYDHGLPAEKRGGAER